MRMLRCDICGEEVPKYYAEGNDNPLAKNWKTITIEIHKSANFDENDKNNEADDFYDICPECFEKVFAKLKHSELDYGRGKV